jgi:hypothetical protein
MLLGALGDLGGKSLGLPPKKSERLPVAPHPNKAINVAVYYPRIPGP